MSTKPPCSALVGIWGGNLFWRCDCGAESRSVWSVRDHRSERAAERGAEAHVRRARKAAGLRR